MSEPEFISATEAPVPVKTSLGSRLVNIFVAPTEVFDEVKASPPCHANWIAPTLLAILMVAVYVVMVYSQGQIIQRVREAQTKGIQAKVAEGKLTQQKADQAAEMMEKFMTPTVFKFSAGIAVSFIMVVMLFLQAFAIWLIGKHGLRGNFRYVKALEVVGLTEMISVLGLLISALVAVIYGDISRTPGPVLLLSHFDHANKLHLLLSALNVFSIWGIALMSLGMARLSGASFGKAATFGFILWALAYIAPALLFGGK